MGQALTPRLRLRPVYVVIGSLFALLVLTVGLVSANASASAPAQEWPASSQERPETRAPECGPPEWQVLESPNVGRNENALNGVAVISNSDVWAVGYYIENFTSRTLIEHWNGSTWDVVPSPNGSTLYNALNGVTAISTSNVWAVGYYRNPDVVTSQTLIEHWDGSAWSIALSPNVGTNDNELTAVAAFSNNDVWAVGFYFDNNNSRRTLIVHWDGSTWDIVSSPNVGTGHNALSGVAAISDNDIWAVGHYVENSEYRTLIEHWDGSAWNVVPSPNVGTGGNTLTDVAAISENDVWAVGYYLDIVTFASHVLTIHWDGSSWSVVPSPSLGEIYTDLKGVAAVSHNDVWAVGLYYDPGLDTFQSLTFHWNGSAWGAVKSAVVNGYNHLNAVATTSGDDVWAVGVHLDPLYRTLVEKYDPQPIPCPSTPTPVPPRCPGERFTDVCPTDYFYPHVLDLYNLGIVSGYNTVPPCDGPAHIPCFKPYNLTTRGQVSKIISLSAGFNEPPGQQMFEDVPPGHTFYDFIWRMAARGIIVGYPCGGFGEPCIPPDNRPFFRPGITVNRAQLSKMAALSFGFQDPVSGQTFEDVVPENHFYPFIENLASRNIINGYPCGSPGEPCVPPGNRPYFRYGNPITRGQVAKIVNLARLQPTPTPTATNTPMPTRTNTATNTRVATRTPGTPSITPTIGTPTATPTCAPSSKGWNAGPDLPVPIVRAFGAYFPPNGNFYSLGGRRSDTAGEAQLNPLEYSPATNTWITMTAQFSDQSTSNIQGGVVTMDGIPVIILVGGSAGGSANGTTETRVYNPIADTLVTLADDPWPPGATTVPGGSAVVNNRVYILGGFVINTAMSAEIWEFNPDAEPAERWTLLPETLLAPLGYIPTTAIDDIIYMAGGSGWDGVTIYDTNSTYKYDPATGTIDLVAGMPRFTAETRAVNMDGKMWVLGGGRDAPNPSNQVDIYDPATDSWSSGFPFLIPRRNFAADSDGSGKVYLAGGYSSQGAPLASMQIYSTLVVCGTSTPAPTHTPTETTTPAPGAIDTPTPVTR